MYPLKSRNVPQFGNPCSNVIVINRRFNWLYLIWFMRSRIFLKKLSSQIAFKVLPIVIDKYLKNIEIPISKSFKKIF